MSRALERRRQIFKYLLLGFSQEWISEKLNYSLKVVQRTRKSAYMWPEDQIIIRQLIAEVGMVTPVERPKL